jgi:hypothetical protein
MPRKIAANWIITFAGSPIKNGYLEIADSGIIEKVVNTNGIIPEIAGLEYYNGVVVPGFIFYTNSISSDLNFNYLWLNGIQTLIIPPGQKREKIPEYFQVIEASLDISFSLYQVSAPALPQLLKKQVEENSFIEALKLAISIPAGKFGIDNQLGRITPGINPGILLISPFDFKNNQLTAHSIIRRLI